MTQQLTVGRLGRISLRSESVAVSEATIRVMGALLALAVATAHVADQGGLTAFSSPDWLGWTYRLIEVGGVLTALTLMWRRFAKLGWAAGVLLGIGPFLGYIASRTVGVPGDGVDVGNWGDWVGTVALILEAGIVTISLGMLRAGLQQPTSVSRPAAPLGDRRGPGLATTSWDLVEPTPLN
jgi:hypothetical protein